eukprot:jgi/Chlat1/5054/Chrsp33S05059
MLHAMARHGMALAAVARRVWGFSAGSRPVLLQHCFAASAMASAPAETEAKPPRPPFNEETARIKVQLAEDAWNSRDPERVAQAYTEDSDWRNRTEFFRGRQAIKEFLTRKWSKELDYKLMKELWCYQGDRISVRFEYEWHDDTGQWYRTHGNEHWEFDDRGLMRRRDMSANDYPINYSERRIKV